MRTLAILLASGLSLAAQVQVYMDGDRTVYLRPNTDPAFNERGIGHPPRGTDPQLWYVYDPYIRRFARTYGVDPVLAKAIIWQESRFHWRATSAKRARGLMQVCDGTAATLGGASGSQGLGLYDPIENIRLGIAYVSQLQNQFQGNLFKITAAYNSGPGRVQRHGGIPPIRETQDYVPAVLTMYCFISSGR